MQNDLACLPQGWSSCSLQDTQKPPQSHSEGTHHGIPLPGLVLWPGMVELSLDWYGGAVIGLVWGSCHWAGMVELSLGWYGGAVIGLVW